MKLPSLTYADGIRKGKQVKFAGLNHNLWAGDGDIWDMKNLTSDHAPLLASRPPRKKAAQLRTPRNLLSWEGLCWIDGTEVWLRGEKTGLTVSEEGAKRMAALGAYVVIFPDKVWLNVDDGTYGSMEAEWSGTSLTFTNGLYKEEAAEANTLCCPGVDWSAYFRPGDAVTISGCTVHPENNKTPIIREIDGERMYFYEYVFTLEGEEGNVEYTETGALTVKREVPTLRYLCENENRLWGCDERTIYACKPGDIFNWNVFDGLEDDSYWADTGSEGDFTGCIQYLGYPVFFKEWHIYKVYGSTPSNFQLMGSATLGVAEGSGDSLAVAGETLFYLSPAGWMAYSGGIPQPVGEAFGAERHKNAVGGSDGLKYYCSARLEDGSATLCVYDTRKGLWHREDDMGVVSFARHAGDLYALNEAGEVWIMGTPRSAPEDGEEEAPVEWWAEFGDFTEEDPNKKGVSKLQIRMELDAGAEAEVWIRFDSDGKWSRCGKKLEAAEKRSYYLPIVPRRADHYRLRLKGVGGCRVYSVARESYSGSELRSTPGNY